MSFAQRIDALRSSTVAPQGWTLARAIAHCAQSIEYSLTGYPRLRSGLFRATIGPVVKRKFLRARRMTHDVLAPVAGAPDIAETITLADACDRAIAALARFDTHAGPFAPHLAYGTCSKAEYAQLHELHFDDHLRSFGLA